MGFRHRQGLGPQTVRPNHAPSGSQSAGREPGSETWVWAPFILLTTATIQYIGASIAVHLFATVAVIAVGWARGFFGSLMLLAWRRPRIDLTSREGWTSLIFPAIYGISLVSTNIIFYFALARIPLGTTVALEFLGPVLLAAMLGRGWRVRVGIVLAVLGVFLISWVGVDMSEPGVAAGVFFAILAGLTWAVYMYVGRKLAVSGIGLNSLAIGMFIGTLVWLPVSIPHLGDVFGDIRIIGLVALVGLLSSVVPYVMDAVIMRRINAGTFALLNSLLPATSLVVGLILLKQVPTAGEIAGLIAITVAVALATYPGRHKRA